MQNAENWRILVPSMRISITIWTCGFFSHFGDFRFFPTVRSSETYSILIFWTILLVDWIRWYFSIFKMAQKSIIPFFGKTTCSEDTNVEESGLEEADRRALNIRLVLLNRNRSLNTSLKTINGSKNGRYWRKQRRAWLFCQICYFCLKFSDFCGTAQWPCCKNNWQLFLTQGGCWLLFKNSWMQLWSTVGKWQPLVWWPSTRENARISPRNLLLQEFHIHKRSIQ